MKSNLYTFAPQIRKHTTFATQFATHLGRRLPQTPIILTITQGGKKSSLGFSKHEMVEFKILRAARSAHSKLPSLDFRRGDFALFRDLPGRVP